MKLSRRTKALLALVSLLLVMLAPDAMAGAGGTEFNNVWTLLTGWPVCLAINSFMVSRIFRISRA